MNANPEIQQIQVGADILEKFRDNLRQQAAQTRKFARVADEQADLIEATLRRCRKIIARGSCTGDEAAAIQATAATMNERLEAALASITN